MVAALIMPRSADAGPVNAEVVAQPLDHRQQSGDIGRIAGPQEGGDRPVLLVQHDTQHDLRELRAKVLGMTALTQRGTTAAFEIQRGGVEEGDRERAEQRFAMLVERLLDGIGAMARLAAVVAPDLLTELGHGLEAWLSVSPATPGISRVCCQVLAWRSEPETINRCSTVR
jgi:hypothetical protein